MFFSYTYHKILCVLSIIVKIIVLSSVHDLCILEPACDVMCFDNLLTSANVNEAEM